MPNYFYGCFRHEVCGSEDCSKIATFWAKTTSQGHCSGDDPDLLKKVITGDESWMYGNGFESKAQSSQWKRPEEPRWKKARQVCSNVKVLLTVFFDCNAMACTLWILAAKSYGQYLLEVMRRLGEVIRHKRTELWKIQSCILHHDNAPAHTC